MITMDDFVFYTLKNLSRFLRDVLQERFGIIVT